LAATLESGAENDRRLRDIQEALQAKDFDRAVALARAALDGGFVHPMLLNLRAYWLEEQQRHKEACADLQRARELAPQSVPVLNALGLCLVNCSRPQDAVEAFAAALAVQPDFLPARFNLAWASEMTGNLAAAREEYREVIRRQPEHLNALAGLALLSTRLGDWEAARRNAALALAIDATHPNALLALASADIEDGKGKEAELRLSALVQNEALHPAAHALARGLLADALDRQGRYRDAFAAYRASNEELRRIHAPRFEDPGVESACSYVSWLADYFQNTNAWARMPAGPSRRNGPINHIFIAGFPRSGTTLFEQIIGAHALAVTTEEKDALADSVRAYMACPDDLTRLARSTEQDLLPFRDAYWRRIEKAGFDVAGKILVDKLPLTTVKLPLVARLFPDAKVIFAVRDPRDVVLSCFRRRFTMNPSMFEFLTLEGTARFYGAVMRLAGLYREKLPLNLHQLRHEDLLENFDKETRATCEFCGIEWREEMREFAGRAKARAIATPSAVQLMRGLNRQGVEHWRKYAEDLEPVMPLLRPWIAKFGYNPD